MKIVILYPEFIPAFFADPIVCGLRLPGTGKAKRSEQSNLGKAYALAARISHNHKVCAFADGAMHTDLRAGLL
ncbi:MAG: hypothetical protein ACOYKJ_08555 [Candidatus Howiella sp.]